MAKIKSAKNSPAPVAEPVVAEPVIETPPPVVAEPPAASVIVSPEPAEPAETDEERELRELEEMLAVKRAAVAKRQAEKNDKIMEEVRARHKAAADMLTMERELLDKRVAALNELIHNECVAAGWAVVKGAAKKAGTSAPRSNDGEGVRAHVWQALLAGPKKADQLFDIVQAAMPGQYPKGDAVQGERLKDGISFHLSRMVKENVIDFVGTNGHRSYTARPENVKA